MGGRITIPNLHKALFVVCKAEALQNLKVKNTKNMFIKKQYQVRHKILETLFDYDNSFNIAVPTNEKLLHFNEICKKLSQFDKVFLLDNLNYLQNTKEIYCTMQFDNSSFAIIG